MKFIILLTFFVMFNAMNANSAERVICYPFETSVAKNEFLILEPEVEIGHSLGSIDFNSLNNEFTTKSLTIQTSILSTRHLLVSAKIDDSDLIRALEFKVHQKKNNKYMELSRTRYRLNYKELAIRYEGISFGFIVPGTKIYLEFNCTKY